MFVAYQKSCPKSSVCDQCES